MNDEELWLAINILSQRKSERQGPGAECESNSKARVAETCDTGEIGRRGLQKSRGLDKELGFYFKGNRKSLENIKTREWHTLIGFFLSTNSLSHFILLKYS